MQQNPQISLYQQVDANLGIGDRVRLRVSDIPRGFTGGLEYKVEAIKGDYATLKNDTDTLKINLKNREDQIWDYAYTNTTFSIQGDTKKYAIGLELFENDRGNYIQITRASEHAIIYTSNKAKLLTQLDDEKVKYEASKRSAYELFGQNKEKNASSKQSVYEFVNQKNEDKNLKIHDQKTQESQPVHEKKTSKITPTKSKIKPVLADDLKPLLKERSEELAIHLLGEPNQQLSNRSQLRFGHKGSLSVTISGQHQGKWRNFETGKQGNSLDLIKSEMGYSNFKDVLTYAKNFLNYEPTSEPVKQESVEKVAKIDLEETQRKEKMKQYATKLFNNSKPIKGTLAEKYLNQARGLNNYHDADIRFLPAISGYAKNKKTGEFDIKVYTPAVLAFVKDKDNQINHVQVIRLDRNGNKNKEVKLAKQTYGSMNGFAVELNNKANREITYLSEGIETGLSILNINKKAHVLAVLGKSNFANIDLEKIADKIILALDNDGISKTFSDKTIVDAVKRLQENGKDVQIIMPEKPKSDFNDVLKNEGYQALSKQINQSLSAKDLNQVSLKLVSDHFTKSENMTLNQALSLIGKDIKYKDFDAHNKVKINDIDHKLLKNIDQDYDIKTDKNLNKQIDSVLNEQVKYDQIENILPEKTLKIDKEMEL
ncbi:toprim domain-containing protein [Thiotrichales bacterium 19X7-9]|nr:toprim domain-containing protein [Thiotrichales bacterium 19X7-9]